MSNFSMPLAASDTPDIGDVILAAMGSLVRNFAVAQPGTVTSYDADSQTCSVTPGVHRLVPTIEDGDDDETEPLPTIPDVKVCWLVGRGIQVKGTLQPGDTVLLVALDFDPSAWMRAGSAQPPDDARAHHWAHAVAIPGLVPDTSPFPEPTDAAALASKVDALIATLKTTAPGPASNVAALLATKFPDVPASVGLSVSGGTGSTILKLGA
ncbi:MAG: hypothetical protein RLZZ450_89 [Pseudomonadota bacterium]|jgi:hypothetical protein